MSLPFIPLDNLQTFFDSLMDNSNESIVDFATYMESTYNRGEPGRDKRQTVPKECGMYMNLY